MFSETAGGGERKERASTADSFVGESPSCCMNMRYGHVALPLDISPQRRLREAWVLLYGLKHIEG